MLKGNPFVVQGFEIPSDNPFFLTILSIHILAALTCVVTGAMAMLTKKQAGLHPKSGSIYFWSLLIVFVTATIMAVLRWKEDYHLFIFGLIAFSSALIGRTARRNIWDILFAVSDLPDVWQIWCDTVTPKRQEVCKSGWTDSVRPIKLVALLRVAEMY
jgi:hypothetical protein